MSTCKWCGKQFYYESSSRGSRSTAYCCGRCYNAAMREEQRAREESRKHAEESRQTLKQIGGGSESRGCLIVAAIVVAFVLIFGSSKQSNEEKAEEVQKTVTTQPIVEVESNEQIMPVVNQPEMSVIDAETENKIMPELLDVPKQQIELVEVEERTGWEDAEMEKVSEPDFSRQKVYQSVEVDEEPQFPGGERGLLDYIDENLIYPQTAIEEAVQGRVFVNFIIEPNGSVSNVKVLRGLGFGCDEEAVRIIKSLPNWEPARRRNKEVRVAMTVPVNFKL